jgi:hypothetical protein
MNDNEIKKYNNFKNLGDLDLIFFGYTLLTNYKKLNGFEIEEKLSILKKKSNYKKICKITDDHLHQVMYDEIKTGRFIQHPRIIKVLLLYIKIGHNPELLISKLCNLINSDKT